MTGAISSPAAASTSRRLKTNGGRCADAVWIGANVAITSPARSGPRCSNTSWGAVGPFARQGPASCGSRPTGSETYWLGCRIKLPADDANRPTPSYMKAGTRCVRESHASAAFVAWRLSASLAVISEPHPAADLRPWMPCQGAAWYFSADAEVGAPALEDR